MSGKELNFAIIGCGRIAKKHAENLLEIKNVNLIAVCDIDKKKVDEFSEKYRCISYTDYNELLKNKDIDVVNICTPHDLHAEMTIKSARAKKHVITEKPMGVTLREGREMIEICKQEGVRLFVVKQNRYNPPIQKLKEAICRGRFGKIFFANARIFWSRSQSYYDACRWRGKSFLKDGVLMNQTSHHIDLLQWLVGPIESVFCKSGTMTHNIETEDTAVVVLKFKNGVLGTFEATTSTYFKNLEGSITILGEKGSVKVGGFAANKMDYWEFDDFDPEDETIKECFYTPPNVYGYGHKLFLENAIGSILNEKRGLVDGVEGNKSLRIIFAMLKSSKENREVFVDEIKEENLEEVQDVDQKRVSILLTGVGTSTAHNIIDALRKQKNYKIKIIATDTDPLASGLYLADKKYMVPKFNDPNYVPRIFEICKREGVDIIIPGFSKEIVVFSENKEKFERQGIKIAVSPSEIVNLFNDKYKTMQFFKKENIPFPKTYLKEEINEITNFPVYLKPNLGSGTKNHHIAKNKEELLNLLEKIENPIIQEYIEGVEYTIDLLTDKNGELIVAVPRERISVKDGKCVKGKTVYNKRILDYIGRIIQSTKIIGPANIQCIIDKNEQPKFIEINPRFAAGGLPLTVHSGANLPYLLIQTLLGEEIKKEEKEWEENIYMTRYLTDIFLKNGSRIE